MRVRRYEALEPSRDVKERVKSALFDVAATSLHIRLADPYEGKLPIPPKVEGGEVEFRVIRVARSQGESLKAYGLTSEKSAITVTIPHDLDEHSIVALLDTATPPAPSETS